jgi:TRAP-type C4-dicarboxylate transport system substrate-binding protein
VPHPAALTELGNAFDAGLTEVVDVPIIYLFGTSLDAKIHHYTASRHIMQLGVFLIARPAWEQVSAGRKLDAALIDRVFVEAEAAHEQLDRELIADLRRRGVQVTELSADGRRRFMAAGEPVTEWVKQSATPRERALFERTRAWLQQHERVRR